MRNLCFEALSGADNTTITGSKIDSNRLVSAIFMFFLGTSLPSFVCFGKQ